MYTANLNFFARETIKKCSCLLSCHFLLVRYAKMCILMAAILKHLIGPPLVSDIVIHISELGSLLPKTPEKWSCLLFYDYLLARNVKMCFLMAAFLNRPIWRPHWKYQLWLPADWSTAGRNVSMYQIWCFCTNLQIHSPNSLDYDAYRSRWRPILCH